MVRSEFIELHRATSLDAKLYASYVKLSTLRITCVKGWPRAMSPEAIR